MAFNQPETNKRKHKRYNLTRAGFALLKTRDEEVLGSIVDISAGGLCLLHIDGDDKIKEDSLITINLIAQGSHHHKQISGRNIWSKKEEEGLSTALIKMKRRGIQFENLSKKMQIELNEFIYSLLKK